jgi:four helix bundle protein
MPSEYSFRNLVLWQKAQQLAEEVVAVVAGLPPGPVSAVVGRQLLAAASSIGANVAEGHGRFSLAAH